MFGGLEARQPLLPAKQHAKRRQRRAAPAAARRRRQRLALAGLAAVAAAGALLYHLAPAVRPGDAATEAALRDGERELQLLHGQPSPRFCSLPPPLVCAHGGDAAVAPPNTAAAFAAALAGGARCLEVDVARTRDGRLVVLHARELAHLLQLAGGDAFAGPRRRWWRRLGGAAAPPPRQVSPQVGDFTWAELQRLRWEGGQGVELVESVLRLAVPAAQQITLDLKPHTQAGEEVEEDVLAQAVVDVVRRTACAQCLVWAKSDALVRLVKGLDPGQRVGYVVLNETAAARAAGLHRLLRWPGAEVVALHHAMASDAAVTEAARAASMAVHAWTANTAGMMRAVLDAGVDAVVTNHPRKLQEAVDSRLRACRAGGGARSQLQQQPEPPPLQGSGRGAGGRQARGRQRQPALKRQRRQQQRRRDPG